MSDIEELKLVVKERGRAIEEAYKEGYMAAYKKCLTEEERDGGIDPIMLDDYEVRHEDRLWETSQVRHKYLCRCCRKKSREQS